MKSYLLGILISVVLLYSPFSFSQHFESSAFGGPVLKFTTLKSQGALIAGGRAGWMINKSIVLGGGIYGLISNVKSGLFDTKSNQNVLLGMNYGGLEFEYIFLSESVVHASLDMLFAGGGVYFSVPNKNVPHTNYFSQDMLVWEPEFNLELRIAKWFNLAAGVSYRIITSYGVNYGISKDDLKGLNGVLTFKFGTY